LEVLSLIKFFSVPGLNNNFPCVHEIVRPVGGFSGDPNSEEFWLVLVEWEEGFASNGSIAQILAMIDHIVLIDGLDSWEVSKDFL
jgi:hypothetical protein